MKSILLKKNYNINNHSNLLLKAKRNLFNYFDNSNIKLFSKGVINKNDIASFIEIKNKPLIVKLNSKRSSSCLKGKKINEKIRKLNKNQKFRSSNLYYYEEEKRIKTPTNRVLIESDRDKNKIKESLSEYINLEKKFFKLKKKNTNKVKNLKNFNIVPEENHFKAVMLSQEIKKLNKNLE